MIKIVDTHSHHFFYENLDEVMLENKAKGVIYIIENGLDPKTNRVVLEESKKYDFVLPALGYHPTDVSKAKDEEIEKELEFIEKNKDKIVAIGEIGLDYYWIMEKELRKKQILWFRKFLELAERIKKPVIVHSRKAESECLDILESFKIQVVLHSFGGRIRDVRRALENGYYFSIPAIVYKLKHYQRIVEEVPLDLLLLETDSPFLDPVEHRKNKSWKIIYGIDKISEILKIEKVELAEKIYRNFVELFL